MQRDPSTTGRARLPRILRGATGRRRMTADLRATVAELSERVDRLERRQLRFQDDATSQLRRADAVAEDLVAAVDALRRRLEAVETTSQS